MTIHVWTEPTYYDGMWAFPRVLVSNADGMRIRSWSVTWLGDTLTGSYVMGTS